jgi:hypothetical protein
MKRADVPMETAKELDDARRRMPSDATHCLHAFLSVSATLR